MAVRGTQPPLMQTPPPIAVKGSGKPLQSVGKLLFGTQPPLMHWPPPLVVNGSGVPLHSVGPVGVDDVIGRYCQPPLMH